MLAKRLSRCSVRIHGCAGSPSDYPNTMLTRRLLEKLLYHSLREPRCSVQLWHPWLSCPLFLWVSRSSPELGRTALQAGIPPVSLGSRAKPPGACSKALRVKQGSILNDVASWCQIHWHVSIWVWFSYVFCTKEHGRLCPLAVQDVCLGLQNCPPQAPTDIHQPHREQHRDLRHAYTPFTPIMMFFYAFSESLPRLWPNTCSSSFLSQGQSCHSAYSALCPAGLSKTLIKSHGRY